MASIDVPSFTLEAQNRGDISLAHSLLEAANGIRRFESEGVTIIDKPDTRGTERMAARSRSIEINGVRVSIPIAATSQNIQTIIDGANTPNCKHPPLSETLSSTRLSENVQLIQLKTTHQWHPATCGAHALLNVELLLNDNVDEEQATTSHTNKDTKSDTKSDCLSADAEVASWSYVFECLKECCQHGEKSGMWTASSMESGTFDACHLKHLVGWRQGLAGRVTVIDSLEANNAVEHLKTQVHKACRENRKHAFLLGAVRHWMSCVVDPSTRTIFVLDSDNKPWDTLLSPDEKPNYCVFARDRVNEWCASARESCRRTNPALTHFPDETLDREWRKGMPSYWRGELMCSLYWRNKPADVHVDLVCDEAKSFSNTLRLLSSMLACALDHNSITNDDLFFGTQPVKLAPVAGLSEPHVAGELQLDRSPEGLARTKARSAPISIRLGEDNTNDDEGNSFGIVPAMPCLDLVAVCGLTAAEKLTRDNELVNTTWPRELRVPLMKISLDNEQPLRLKAIASGVRSVVMKAENGQWYRLKGCGNNNGPFIVRTSLNGTKEIRGSAFVHTARRELEVASRLETNLPKAAAVAGNAPLGLWMYEGEMSPFGVSETTRTACVVMRTHGERRLGSHLLGGLELLLPLLLPRDVDGEVVKNLFPKSRPSGLNVSTAQLMTDEMLAFELGVPGHGLEWPDVVRDASTLANLTPGNTGSLRGCCPEPSADPPSQWSNTGPQPMDHRWREVWVSTCSELIATNVDVVDALAWLFKRLGKDAGLFLRSLHKHRVSWGTYQDALCSDGQWHCNAHTNNFVILSESEQLDEVGKNGGDDIDAVTNTKKRKLTPTTTTTTTTTTTNTNATTTSNVCANATNANASSNKDNSNNNNDNDNINNNNNNNNTNSPLIGYVDLDMAFAEDDRDGDSDEDFTALLEREKVNFFEVLGGGDASSGVPQVALAEIDGQAAEVRGVKNLLYDTMVLACRTTYDNEYDNTNDNDNDNDNGGEGSIPPNDNNDATNLRAAATLLIRMALIVTSPLVV